MPCLLRPGPQGPVTQNSPPPAEAPEAGESPADTLPGGAPRAAGSLLAGSNPIRWRSLLRTGACAGQPAAAPSSPWLPRSLVCGGLCCNKVGKCLRMCVRACLCPHAPDRVREGLGRGVGNCKQAGSAYQAVLYTEACDRQQERPRQCGPSQLRVCVKERSCWGDQAQTAGAAAGAMDGSR